MKPIVFLDIDGVLLIQGCSGRDFIPTCVHALNLLTDTTTAPILVSSVWRFNHDIKEVLQGNGVKAHIVGVTPDLLRGRFWRSFTRGAEINAWVKSHAPRPFVILDDDNDMEDLSDHLVQTSWESGLTLPLAEMAAKRLMQS